ncbi:transmembrane protein 106A isoform X2 [Petaurus breviceps papuanus]|uniref:transmembrane protein 106A isoform X2 n=1 Tax=Petaurus breviceps papuanus TaxID=3040969 RepID=UPI0036DAC165
MMGETISRFGSQDGESKSILTQDPTVGSEASSYSSINGSKSVLSCVPCAGSTDSSFVTCPTCQGTGEIPGEHCSEKRSIVHTRTAKGGHDTKKVKNPFGLSSKLEGRVISQEMELRSEENGSLEYLSELEKQLVALIPYGDQRLKPRRTKLYVSLAVLTCLLMSTLIFFFLFPRSIVVQPAGLSYSVVVSTGDAILLNVTNALNITNNNYYPITVTQINIEVLHLSLVVGQLEESKLLHIGPLGSEQMFYAVTSKIIDENTYKICSWKRIKVHNILQHIQGGGMSGSIFKLDLSDHEAGHKALLKITSLLRNV